MSVYRLTEISGDQPAWNSFAKGRLLDLAPGSVVEPHFSDGFRMYFFQSGRARVLERREEKMVAGGDVLAVRPNVWHGIVEVRERTQVLQLDGPPFPPFRRGANDSVCTPAIPLAPFIPPKSPERIGRAINFDEESTVSTMLLASEVGGDLLVSMNMNAVSRNQIEEIRRHCINGHHALAAIILKMNNDQEISEFPLHTSQCLMTYLLRPAFAGIQSNLATEAGRNRTSLMLKHWRPLFIVENICPCIRMVLREFSEFELTDIFQYLSGIPPAHLGIILQIPSDIRIDRRTFVQYLLALFPWLIAVESREGVILEDVENLLEPHGFQGWFSKSL